MFLIKRTKEFSQHMMAQQRQLSANRNAARPVRQTGKTPIVCIRTEVIKNSIQGFGRGVPFLND